MYHHLDFNNCMYVPYIFTKLLRPLIRHWRGLGISTTIFLEVEDNIDMENSPEIFHDMPQLSNQVFACQA